MECCGQSSSPEALCCSLIYGSLCLSLIMLPLLSKHNGTFFFFSGSADGSGGTESFDNLVIQAPQPMREDYIQNAVKFLSHPKVKGSPVFHRRSFLEKKGLTNEEIDEAFRRVPVRFYFPATPTVYCG